MYLKSDLWLSAEPVGEPSRFPISRATAARAARGGRADINLQIIANYLRLRSVTAIGGDVG